MQTDRRTRDRIRLFFWALLTVVCLVAALIARQQQQQGLSRKADAAQGRAIRYTQNVLVDRLDADRISHPIERSGYDELLADVKRDLFTDGRVLRVRIFRPDGLLVFTTDDPSQIGKETAQDRVFASAVAGEIASGVLSGSFAPDTTTTPKPTDLLATFVPMRASDKGRVYGVVEVDTDYGLLRATSSKPWSQLEFAFGILAVLCLVMTILSFIWSRRPQEVSGFSPSRRDQRATVRDDKKVAEAKAEAATLRERVKELESRSTSASTQNAELQTLRARVKELEQRPTETPPASDPEEIARLTARAAQLEDQVGSGEARASQLQARIAEMEAQLRLTTDQLRSANKQLEDSHTLPPEVQAKLQSSEEIEQHLSTELQAAHAEVESLRKALADSEEAHAEEILAQQGQLDQARAQARMADEERQRFLAEAAKVPAVTPEPAPDAASKILELEESLKRSEHERAMLRAGRPETVYEVRNRELEEEIAELKARMGDAESRARTADAGRAGVDPSVITALEERIAAAEERARDAEKRLDESKARTRSRSRTAKSNGGDGDPSADPGAEDVTPPPEPDAPPIDGSELRSRLVRSTDARRRGTAPTPDRH